MCDYFLPGSPVLLSDSMTHWPATTKWNDLNYLKRVAGYRTVPVEVMYIFNHLLAEFFLRLQILINTAFF